MLIRTILNGLYFSGVDVVTTSFSGELGSIWMLHRVNTNPVAPFSPNRHLTVSPDFLDASISRFQNNGYRFVSMDDMIDHVNASDSPQKEKRLIAITLDDGYKDNLEYAVPVFRRHGVPYTIYIAPGLVEAQHGLWWEDLEHTIGANRRLSARIEGQLCEFPTTTVREKNATFRTLMKMLREEISEDAQREFMAGLSKNYGHDSLGYTRSQILDWAAICKLAKDPLCTIGAHTMGHFAVARLDDARARHEMSESRNVLEKKLSQPIRHFAFPYGCSCAVSQRDIRIAAELGFSSAVTTHYGMVRLGDASPFALPRISLNGDYQSIRYLRPLMSPIPGYLKRLASRAKAA